MCEGPEQSCGFLDPVWVQTHSCLPLRPQAVAFSPSSTRLCPATPGLGVIGAGRSKEGRSTCLLTQTRHRGFNRKGRLASVSPSGPVLRLPLYPSPRPWIRRLNLGAW